MDYNSCIEDHAKQWQPAVSSWMKAIHQFESHLKRTAFKRFILKTAPKKEMYEAFEAHGLLVRGFNKLRRVIRSRRARRYHRRSLLKRFFITWQVQSSHVTITPRRRGGMIYACFKWIYHTLCKETPRYYSRWISVEKELSNRIRNYTFGCLELPYKKIPLLLHSVAVLDAFVLRSVFIGWAKHTRCIRAVVSKTASRHKQIHFQAWKTFTYNANKWRTAELFIFRRHAHRVARHIFTEWITIYRSSQYVRTVKRQRLMRRALAMWLGRNHLKHATVKAVHARRSCHARTMSVSLMQWKQWHRWRVVYSKVIGLAIYHHKITNLKRCIETWSTRTCTKHYLRTKHWGLDNLTLRRYAREKRKTPPHLSVVVTRGLNKSLDRCSDSVLFTCRRRFSGHVLSTCVRKAIAKWKDNITHVKDLRTRGKLLRERHEKKLIELTFGAWMLRGVHLMGIKRSANRVVINRFKRILSKSFGTWKHSVSQRVRHREEFKKKEHERMKSLQHRLELWRKVSAHLNCNRHFDAWKKHVWHLKVGRVLRPPLVNYVNKMWLYLAFRKWNAATYEMVIACCIQKIWRGYVTRHLHCRSQYTYLKWIMSGHLRHAIRMNSYNEKRKALRGWLIYVNSHRHMRELRSMRVVQNRAISIFRNRVSDLSRQRRKVHRGYTYWELKSYLIAIRILKNAATLRQRMSYFHMRCKHRRYRNALRLLGSCLPRYAVKLSLVWKRRFDMSKEEGKFACRRYLGKWRVFAYRRRQSSRLQTQARLLFLSKFLPVLRSWKWRARRWSRTSDHPILNSHRHYIRRLRKKSLMRFRWNLSNLNVSYRRQWRLVTTIDRKYNRKRARTALLMWFRVVSRSRAASHMARRVATRPIFLAWYRTFQIFRRNRLRIYKVRVKVMRRIAKGVFLAWSLYTLRSSRLKKSCHLLHQTTLSNHKRKAWNVWREAKRYIELRILERTVFSKYARRSRANTLRRWKLAYRMSSEQTWQNVQTIFHHWARLTSDNVIGREAHLVGASYHSETSLRNAIATWRHRINNVKHMHYNEFEGRKSMLMSRCIQIIRYWRCWSWWMGRRVLYGRVRLLEGDHHVEKETPRHRLVSRFTSTPFLPNRTGGVEFSMSPAYYNSQVDFTGGSFYDLDDDPYRNNFIQGSARLRAIKKKNFRFSSSLLVKGRTPLAFEAAALRALRVWKRYVKKYLETKRESLLVTTFQSWKHYCWDNAHRRLALVSRIRSFQRTYTLHYFFGQLFETCKVGILLKRKAQLLRKRHLQRLWDSWLRATKSRHAHKRQKRNALSIFAVVASNGNCRNMRRLFQVWRVRVYLAGSAARKHRIAIMTSAFDSWVKLQAATRHRHSVLKGKAFYRWASRIHKIAGARVAVLAKQRGATVVRMR